MQFGTTVDDNDHLVLRTFAGLHKLERDALFRWATSMSSTVFLHMLSFTVPVVLSFARCEQDIHVSDGVPKSCVDASQD